LDAVCDIAALRRAAIDAPRELLKKMAMSNDLSHFLVKLLWNGFAAGALVHTAVWLPILAGRKLPRKV